MVKRGMTWRQAGTPFLRRFGTGHNSQSKGTACWRLQAEQKLRDEKEERGPLGRLSFAAE